MRIAHEDFSCFVFLEQMMLHRLCTQITIVTKRQCKYLIDITPFIRNKISRDLHKTRPIIDANLTYKRYKGRASFLRRVLDKNRVSSCSYLSHVLKKVQKG